MKIGIIRGLMPRLSQAEFARSFSKLEPVFITGKTTVEIINYCKTVKMNLRILKNKPIFGIDPIFLLSGKTTHQSWVGVEGLKKACADLDILQTYELYHLFSGQAATIARKLNIPLVCEVWTSFSQHLGYKIPPYSLSCKKVLNQASLFIARSQKAADSLKDLGISKNKIVTIYHGVNFGRFYPKNKKSDADGFKILYVGDLEPFKGVKLLLDIWPKILKIYPGAELLLAGKGSLLKRAQNTPGVKAFGLVGHLKLSQIYQSADLFVSPSIDRYIGPWLWWEEFFSYTLMEACASGLPIVATKSGGIPEEIGKENWLIPQRNKKALLEAIINALSDDVKREQIGEKNYQRAKTLFNLKTQTAKLEKEMFKILKNSKLR